VDPAQSTFHQYVDGLDEFLQPYLEEPNMDYHMDDYYQEGSSNKPVEVSSCCFFLCSTPAWLPSSY
jgi:hypothetical protein